MLGAVAVVDVEELFANAWNAAKELLDPSGPGLIANTIPERTIKVGIEATTEMMYLRHNG